MKEKMELWLTTLKQSILKKAKSTTSPQSFELNPHLMEDCLRHTIHLERMFENFLGKFYWWLKLKSFNLRGHAQTT